VTKPNPYDRGSYSLSSCRCPVDSYAETGICLACPSGTSALEGSKILDECKCPVNTYFTSGANPCINCATGLISVIGSTAIQDCTCPVNQYLDTVTMLCALCPAGAISNGELLFSGCKCAMNSYMDTVSSTCMSCPVSYTSPSGSVDESSCVCEADTYLDGIACLDCPAWSTTNGSTGATDITDCQCEIHRLFDNVLNTCPLLCPDNMRTVPSGNEFVLPYLCELCPDDSYAMNFSCISCPLRSLSVSGSNSLTQCICIPGMYMDFDSVACANCGMGNYCPGILSP
jgi:hypothetical protein